MALLAATIHGRVASAFAPLSFKMNGWREQINTVNNGKQNYSVRLTLATPM